MWDNFFDESSNDAMFLMSCHSQGVIHVNNALLSYSKERRKHIFVLAIAPPIYIDKKICAEVVHIRAKPLRDPFLGGQVYGAIGITKTVKLLKFLIQMHH